MNLAGQNTDVRAPTLRLLYMPCSVLAQHTGVGSMKQVRVCCGAYNWLSCKQFMRTAAGALRPQAAAVDTRAPHTHHHGRQRTAAAACSSCATAHCSMMMQPLRTAAQQPASVDVVVGLAGCWQQSRPTQNTIHPPSRNHRHHTPTYMCLWVAANKAGHFVCGHLLT